MNSVKVEIQNEKGNWCTWNNVAIPVKYGKLLDEQLDYAQLSLVRIKKARFAPMTKARITIESNTEDGGVQGGVLEYLVADDTSEETPVGSGIYNHTLTLIEYTKFLECFPLESLCFTQPGAFKQQEPALTINADDNYFNDTYGDYKYFYKVPHRYYTPAVYGNGDINILPNLTDFLVVVAEDEAQGEKGTFALRGDTDNYIRFDFEDGTSSVFNYGPDGTGKTDGTPPGEALNLHVGDSAKVRVHFGWYYSSINSAPTSAILTDFSFNLHVASYRYPLLPYSLNDVIQRILQLVEPLRKSEEPRFKFTVPEGKEKVFNQNAPEFTFTRSTLREALQEIGGFIHAEPRLTHENEIVWDFYGEEERAEYTNYKTKNKKPLSEYKYRTLQRKRNLDDSANALDSYQQNLVNRLDWQNATTATPFDGGLQTLRMETAWLPSAEENGYHVETIENIDRIVKVELAYNGKRRDITPYVYEKNVYDNLSGIATNYPNAKVTSLYFTHGQKGIYGLFYKNPTGWQNNIGANYAIVNIYNYVFAKSVKELDYTKVQFCVTYVPMYSTRVQQVKQHVQDFLPLPRTINYTQSANSVETQYFGEHIKAAILRIGNAEKNVTMNFRNFDNLPKVGLLFDDEYYIAECSVSVLKDHFECTLGLSKWFNRKSKYIGTSSIKRIYEVSEEQVQERHTVLQDYLLVTDKILTGGTSNKNGYFNDWALSTLQSTFNGHEDDRSIKAVHAIGYNAGGTPQERVLLPVISSAFGNTMEFTWHYKDNYSAGFSTEKQKQDNINRMFTVETEYTDYYGRLYYYFFGLLAQVQLNNITDNSVNESNMLPQFMYSESTDENHYGNGCAGNMKDLVSITDDEGLEYGQLDFDNSNPLVLRKDGRETLKFTYALHFVTDKPDIVIGTALATKNSLVVAPKGKPHLYILAKRLNRFENYIDPSAIVEDLGEQNVTANTMGGYIMRVMSAKANFKGKAWAYAFPTTKTQTTFENEFGEAKVVEVEEGGELLFGKNIDIAVGDNVGTFYIRYIHDIYKYRELLKKNN